MVAKGSASLVRRQLGRRLRRYREKAGKNQDDVVEANVAGRTKIWQIETGKIAVRPGDVMALARLYGIPTAETNELLALAEASRSTGYIEDFGAGLPESVGLYADLEAGAAAVIQYNSELVSGLLQTEEYARAAIEVDRSLSLRVVDQRVAFRMQRQRAFFNRRQPGRLDVILTAGALHVQVGSPAVMEAQIAHLRAVDERDGVSVRVLPFENGLHAAMQGPFTILDFADPDDPSLVYLESFVGSRYIERPKRVAEFRAAFDVIRAQSVPVREFSAMSETPWIKASASASGGECVEMRTHDGMVEVRDSKDPEGAVLRFTSAEWSAWLDGARSGEFDHLI